MKSSDQIRQEFLNFFKDKEHCIVSSAPVVPPDDPTLLFTNAGMNPFKPIFLGEESGYKAEGKVWQRTVNTQKCIRVSGKHNDLEEVGHDTYHHTLFEMLGNWSFGDYFKKEAIEWAWELLVKQWGLQPDRLYATVFGGDEADGLPADDDAADLWAKVTTIKPEHILKYGKKDNFWEMGETGPCGPCSEIHIDLRPDADRAKVPGATLVNSGDPRVMEIWNLVFIQFNRQTDGKLLTLPAKHVDTGMGFERICAVIQKKTSNYDTDVFTPLIQAISGIANIPYGSSDETDIATRVIADHIRAVSFSIADGAMPSNEGRGYVIRRILRRAVRYGWDKLNLKEPFMHKLVATLASQMGHVFPELKQQQGFVERVINAEEDNFLKTLGQGIQLFDEMTTGMKVISGDDAFKLHDTYGFPIDLTTLMARERGLSVDADGFDKRMHDQKSRARRAGKFIAEEKGSTGKWKDIPSKFTGYQSLTSTTALHVAGGFDKPALILSETPFYAESGGQVGDSGLISNGSEIIRVLDVKKVDGFHLHLVDRLPENTEGKWEAIVDQKRRIEIRKHHSATHLLHAALRRHLGTHVTQKGSLVDDHHTRFDFSHFEAVDSRTLNLIEDEVNQKIQENIPVTIDVDVAIEEARKRGAMMLFGEKYGEKVRVVTIDPAYSIELCGGTHVNATGEIGYFRFLHESSVASGIRRVEAVTGISAGEYLRSEKDKLHKLVQIIGVSGDPVNTLEHLIQEKKQLEKELETIKSKAAVNALDEILSGARQLSNGIALITGSLPGLSMDQLKQLGYESLRRKPAGTVTVLGSKDEENGKVSLVCTVTDDLIKEKSLKAGQLVGQIARLVGGGGGGQPNLATAGGKNPEKLSEALDAVASLIEN